jgi:hypothetical protein
MEAMRRMMRKDESAYIRASKTRNSIGNRFEDKGNVEEVSLADAICGRYNATIKPLLKTDGVCSNGF